MSRRARVTILPEQGFGAEGEEAHGVPPDAYLEYEVHLHRIINVTKHDSGGIVKRHLPPILQIIIHFTITSTSIGIPTAIPIAIPAAIAIPMRPFRRC